MPEGDLFLDVTVDGAPTIDLPTKAVITVATTRVKVPSRVSSAHIGSHTTSVAIAARTSKVVILD